MISCCGWEYCEGCYKNLKNHPLSTFHFQGECENCGAIKPESTAALLRSLKEHPAELSTNE